MSATCDADPRHSILFSKQLKNRMEEILIMAMINLRDFYSWYTHDEFVEVPDVIVGELFADRRYEKAHEKRMRHNKTFLFDSMAEMEAATVTHATNSPEAVLEIKERHCRLCQALNSLPEIQGRRIEAHFLLSMSRKKIAESEGVSESAVNASIEKGLRSMSNYFRNFSVGGCFLPDKCPYI
jgi:RNA polymerase sigma-70 factor (ECF subfamily)